MATSSTEPWWLRVQRALGLWPLSLFAAYHLRENWAAFDGRDAWFEHKRAHPHSLLFAGSVLALLLAHALLGAVRSWRAGRSSLGSAADSSFDAARFQAGTGALLLLFLVYHVAQVWPASGDAHAIVDTYQRLWQQLGQPLQLAVYLLGSAALVLHLAHGWYAVLKARFGRLRLAPRYLLAVAAFVLFASYVQLIGWFALGEPTLPFAVPDRASLRVER